MQATTIKIQQALAGLKLGAPQAWRNLALFPLIAPADTPARCLLLDEALRCLAVARKRRAELQLFGQSNDGLIQARTYCSPIEWRSKTSAEELSRYCDLPSFAIYKQLTMDVAVHVALRL
jgi:hypothetical protein